MGSVMMVTTMMVVIMMVEIVVATMLTEYCTECECLDPDFEEDDCEDLWWSSWCQRKKNQGKCNRPFVAQRCQKTCFNCEELSTEAPTEPPCQDKWSTSKCENKKNSWLKPCNWNW